MASAAPLVPGASTANPADAALAAFSEQLCESALLASCNLQDFAWQRCVAQTDGIITQPPLVSADTGAVFAALCSRPGIPNASKIYAVKITLRRPATLSDRRLRPPNVGLLVPPHPNVQRTLASFVHPLGSAQAAIEVPSVVCAGFPQVVQAALAGIAAGSSGAASGGGHPELVADVSDFHAQTLATARRQEGTPLPTPKLVSWATDLLRAAAHCSAVRVAHLDVKADNVLVRVDGSVALADWGSAVQCSTDACTRLWAPHEFAGAPGGLLGGNPAHLAPEVHAAAALVLAQQARGDAAAAVTVPLGKADVWAIGVLLHELATGVHPWPNYPFNGVASGELTGAAAASLLAPGGGPANAPPFQQPQSARVFAWARTLGEPPLLPAGAYPEPLRDLLRWMVAPNPSHRCSAAGALARLDRIAAGGRILPAPSVAAWQAESQRTAAASARTAGAQGADAVPLLVQIKDAFGGLVTIPVLAPPPRPAGSRPGAPVPAPPPASAAGVYTAREAIATAWEMLRVSGPVTDYSLVVAGRKVDPDAPLAFLGQLLRDAPAVLAPGIAADPPAVSVPGYGVQAVKSGPPPAPASSAAAAGEDADTGAAAASGAALAVPAAAVRGNRPALFAFSDRDKPPAISLSEGNTVATCRGAWSTVALNHPGITAGSARGKYVFAVKLLQVEAGAGVAIGVADVAKFDFMQHTLGAQPGSYAYSKTGKVSSGVGANWVEYGEQFVVGDVITVEVDPYAGRIRFWRNNVQQGIAFSDPELCTATLRPAVCLGSTAKNKLARVQLVAPEVREFEKRRAHHRIGFSEDCSTVYNNGKWASVLAAHPGITNGCVTWSVRLDDTKHGAGVAVGVVDVERFDWDKQNLGASPNSWCFSKTGKKGDGSSFQEYSRPFSSGDVITAILDMDACTLSFAVNGENQGVAYDSRAGIGSCALVPAVCLGSTEGNKLAKVSILGSYPAVRRFDRFACNSKLKFSDCGRVVETTDKWGTAFIEHPGVSSGRFSFGVHITSAAAGCGAGVGFADREQFVPQSRNLGAAEHSWCFSKTGKKSSGGQFEAYSVAFKNGEVVSAEVDFDTETICFYVDGRSQGPAFVGGLKDRVLVPAVVLGSTDGGHLTQLTIAPPAVTRLDPRRSHKGILFSNGDKTGTTEGRWCSGFADHPGVSAGVLRYAVRLEGDGGAAVGFAEASVFKPLSQNLGACSGTWALSKTGKVSAGDEEGFKAFADKLVSGDVIGCEVDMTEGAVRFWKNGAALGVAFAAGIAGKKYVLVPAVCIGSNSGGKVSAVTFIDFDRSWS